MEEVWRTVSELDSFYSVSNLGRGKSNERDVIAKNGIKYHYKEKLLSFGCTGKNDYDSIKYHNHKYDLHVLVAKAFPEICGEWFEGCVVHHKDGNYRNNNANNLEIISREEHIKHHKTDPITKEKQRKVAIGRTGYWKGKRLSPEAIEKMAAAHRKPHPRYVLFRKLLNHRLKKKRLFYFSVYHGLVRVIV